MTDATFDPRLARELERFADRVVAPFDPLAVAEAAIARRPARIRRFDLRLLAVAALLVLAGGLAAALASASRPVRPVEPVPGAIAFAFDDGHLRGPRSASRIDLTTGIVTDIVERQHNVSLAPDGRHVAFQVGSDVHLRDTLTGADAVLAGRADGTLVDRYDPSDASKGDMWPAFVWSPGGRWVSWMSCAAKCLGTIAAADGSETNWIPRNGPDLVDPREATFWWWADDDHLGVGPEHGGLLTANGDGSGARECPSPGDCPELDLAPGWVYGDSSVTIDREGVADVAVSWDDREGWQVSSLIPTPDGRTALVTIFPASGLEDSGQLWLVHADGSKAQVDLGPYFTGPLPAVYGPEFLSPDGSTAWIANFTPSDAGGTSAVLVIDLPSARVLARIVDTQMAAWSPDGGRLALLSSDNHVEVVDRDGSNRHPVGPRAADFIDQLAWVR